MFQSYAFRAFAFAAYGLRPADPVVPPSSGLHKTIKMRLGMDMGI